MNQHPAIPTGLRLLLGLLLLAQTLVAQPRITLEHIWKDYLFTPKTVPGFVFQNDGRHYTRLEGGKIKQYDLLSGAETAVLFDAATATGAAGFKGQIDRYAFSADESKLLIAAETEPIYRHSSKSNFFVYDPKTQEMTPVFPAGKVLYATFDPSASKVAFVYANNLYSLDLRSGQTRQITTDGAANAIINGATDWVYEEEFTMDRGFAWSPDGQALAYYRFDEREVPEFTFSNYRGGLYPEQVTFKYPKVGEKNSRVSVAVYHFASQKTTPIQLSSGVEYLPRLQWSRDPNLLAITTLNRHQNHLQLLLANAQTGTTRVLVEEKSKTYVDVHDNLTFLPDGQHFIWTSEQDGWNHLYFYDLQGKLQRQLTKGKYEVTAFYGFDERNQVLFYQAAERSPLERQIYQLSLDGKTKKAIAATPGWNKAQFSSTFDYRVIEHATINTPPTLVVEDRQGKRLRTIEDNAVLRERQKAFGFQPLEFFNFRTKDNTTLNGWMLKPANFNPQQRYPVFMFLYGGPGSQQVTDNWGGLNHAWFQMLAQQGFLVACVDNRGTGGRGEQFKKVTYLQLGKYETADQIEAARYLGALPYADPNHIGIFGWSYGGYMSSLCLFKGADVFKAAIAVAPVTNWRWYDNIYTERYLRTEAENPSGYRDNSPINFVQQLRGDYLLVHGLGDDNVHFQHTAEMVNALVDANKQFDTYFYPNRNHGIAGGTTRLHLYTKMTNFLVEKLQDGKAPLPPPAPLPNRKGGNPALKEKPQPASQTPKQ